MLFAVRFIVLFSFLMCSFSSLAASNGQVMVSVHPLALLVKSAWPHLQVSSLVPINQSPHDFSLKPSDVRRLNQADSVIWLGADFEPYLVKLMARTKSQVDLSLHSQQDTQHGDHEVHDPHLWLQPDLIIPLLESIQTKLALQEPIAFLKQYGHWLQNAKQTLNPLKTRGFVSYHDAFHHWVEFFNLRQLDVVTLNPEKPVGTRHIVEVRQLLASGNVSCLFIEPQFQNRLIKKLTQGLNVLQVKIDPMASSNEVDHANFITFYDSLLEQFQACLQPK